MYAFRDNSRARLLRLLVLAIMLLAPVCLDFSYVQAEEKQKSSGHSKAGQTRGKRPVKKAEPKHEEPQPEAVVGAEKKISHEDFSSEAEAGAPLDVILVLDASGSMKRTDPQRLRDQGAKLFLRFLDEQDRVSIVQFDRDAAELLDFTPAGAANLPEIDKKIDSVSVEGRFTDIESSGL